MECILEDWGGKESCACVHVTAVAKPLPFLFPPGMEMTAAMHE